MQSTVFELLTIITLLVAVIAILYYKTIKLQRQIDVLGGTMFVLIDAVGKTNDTLKGLTSVVSDILSDAACDADNEGGEE